MVSGLRSAIGSLRRRFSPRSKPRSSDAPAEAGAHRAVVVHCRSISYTGTTWINLVLASTPGSFMVGPPDRFFELVDEAPGQLCLVHGDDCTFWPRFCASYDREGNFFVQLAEAAGGQVPIINNVIPTGMGRHLDAPEVEARELIVVRDGRAVVASYLRKFENHDIEAALAWYAPAAESMLGRYRDSGGPLLRYEDLIDEPEPTLARLRDELGLALTPASLRYFEHEHHPIAGNQGALGLLRRHRGLESTAPSVDFYDAAFASQSERNGIQLRDERWKQELSADALEQFDERCGAVNRAFGYR